VSHNPAERLAWICPGCQSAVLTPVLHVARIPINATAIVRERQAALDAATGQLDLVCCAGCGLVHNAAYEEERIQFDEDYESSQGYSATFARFQEELAAELARRHPLAGGRIVEIGCGKGEFLGLLCDVADARGLGFDPTFVPGRVRRGADRITVRRQLFDRTLSRRVEGDLICCMMTLEHIGEPARFLGLLAAAAAANGGCPVVVLVPNAEPLLRRGQFWDFYYEHCNYFTPGTLARMFRRCGLDVTLLRPVYDGQYLLIEARPGRGARRFAVDDSPDDARALAGGFRRLVQDGLADLAARLDGWGNAGRRVAFWGSGSRATALANFLALGDEVSCFVDINPYRQGSYIPGTGHPVVGPDELGRLAPDLVVVLNPVYVPEIRQKIAELRLCAEVTTL
jgi:hypothetical protein